MRAERTGIVKWRMVGMVVGGVAVAGVAVTADGNLGARIAAVLLGVSAIVLGIVLLIRRRDAPWV